MTWPPDPRSQHLAQGLNAAHQAPGWGPGTSLHRGSRAQDADQVGSSLHSAVPEGGREAGGQAAGEWAPPAPHLCSLPYSQHVVGAPSPTQKGTIF